LSLRSLVLEAQTAPIRFAERAAQVKHMLEPTLRGEEKKTKKD